MIARLAGMAGVEPAVALGAVACLPVDVEGVAAVFDVSALDEADTGAGADGFGLGRSLGVAAPGCVLDDSGRPFMAAVSEAGTLSRKRASSAWGTDAVGRPAPSNWVLDGAGADRPIPFTFEVGLCCWLAAGESRGGGAPLWLRAMP